MARYVDPDDAAQLMMQAGLQPLTSYPGSAKKWKCRCLECKAVVYPRHSSIKQGRGGCDHCAKRNAFAKQRLPEEVAIAQMREAGLNPLEPYKSSKSKWRCECLTCSGEVVISHDSVRQGKGCRNCGTSAAARRRRDRNASDAEQVMLDAGLQPLEPYPGTTKRWLCQCLKCGREVSPTHDKVKQTGNGCRYCSLKRRADERRMDSAEAISIMEAAGLRPLEPYASSMTPWRCECLTCGRESTPTLGSIRRGQQCKYCARTAVVPEEAVQVMRDAGLEPLTPFKRVNDPWPCICTKCGRDVNPSYTSIRTGRGCRFCAGKAVVPEEAVEIMRAHDFEPLEPYRGSLKPWPSRCMKCGKKSSPVFAAVKSQGTRCRYCQRIAVDPKDAERTMRKGGFIPLVAYPGADKPWPCRCKKCKKEVAPTLGTVRAGGGCRYCATKGINLNMPAIVYVITHDAFNAHKIGIGAPSGYRLQEHRRQGWEVFKTLLLETGDEAFEVERKVLEWLRNELGLTPAVPKELMPQRGETETVSADQISLPELWAKVIGVKRNLDRAKGSKSET